MKLVGRPVERREDARLLTGRGRYVGDVVRPHALTAAVVRSPHAHALIRRIDTGPARALPGVVACVTIADLGEVAAIPTRLPLRPALHAYLQRPLAADRVRYVGEPVAVVVAADQYVAEDARELVEVDYEALPAVVDAERAVEAGAPPLFPGGNLIEAWTESVGDVDAAFQRAARVVRRRFAVPRQTGVPMEPRGLVAEYDEGGGVLTVWGPTKIPYFTRQVLAGLLGLGEDRIHLVEPDVGGGFGVRGEFYPEDFLVPLLALRLGRPVRWIEDRLEHFAAINHSREQRWTLAVAVEADGRLLGIDATLVNDHGAYLRPHGTLAPHLAAAYLPGPYRVPAYRCRASTVVTNKTPTGTLRAPGFYECSFVRERALDLVAAGCGIDPAEVRRRNLITPDCMPYAVGTELAGHPVVLDPADFPAVFERGLEAARYRERCAERGRANAGDPEVRVGIGIACMAEPTGRGPFESARVRLTPAGTVHVYTGATSMGQGHETTLAQVCADALGVPLDAVLVRHGDTELVPYGVGTFASRAAVMAGSAVHYAALALRERILGVAARHLEADPGDLVLEDGRVSVAGVPQRGCALREIAVLASPPGRCPPLAPESLDVTHYHHSAEEATAFAVHVAVVLVDTRTGTVTPQHYAVACDVGRALNPRIVEGQVAGGVVHGLGGAILEELVYDEHGQLLTTTFMDYLIPGPGDVPAIEVLLVQDTPPASNPLGARGVGEVGTSAVGAALANAVADALGVDVTRLPLTPERVLRLLAASRSNAGEDRARDASDDVRAAALPPQSRGGIGGIFRDPPEEQDA